MIGMVCGLLSAENEDHVAVLFDRNLIAPVLRFDFHKLFQ